VVTVFDSGEHGRWPYIVMEQLSGWTLHDQLKAGPLPVPAVRSLAAEVLAALAAAHAAGILHRDVKPSNILAGTSGQWKVADFGIAKMVELPGGDDTVTGELMGTPAYLAPERFFGAQATVAADLYAVGAVLYEALTGQKPIQASNPAAWPSAAATTMPAPLRSLCPAVDPDLADVTERSLAKDPDQRFRSASDMTAALSGTQIGPAPVLGPAPLGAVVEATEALPESQRPPAASRFRPGSRPRLLLGLGVVAAVAVLVVLSAVVGLYAGSGPSRGSNHLPPPTSVATATTVSPPTPPATVTGRTAVTPAAKPPVRKPGGPGHGSGHGPRGNNPDSNHGTGPGNGNSDGNGD
jgi:serine/threonine-protein kinase